MGYPELETPFESHFDFMFTFVPIMIGLIFVLVFGTIIYRAIKGGQQWNRNNNSPVLTVRATVIAKRSDIHVHHHGDGVNDMNMHTSSSTTYYVTFQVQSGDRMEFVVQGNEYGVLIEGDEGDLTFQGTRYKGFVRL
jgi:hypothetical protein